MTKFCKFKNNIVVANTTPHTVTMQDIDGELINVENNPDKIINANTVQLYWDGIYTEPKFEATNNGRATIAEIKKDFEQEYNSGETLVIIGSIIAAQAYPEEVAAMLPVPGYERVAPNEKRMRCNQFTMYRRK